MMACGKHIKTMMMNKVQDIVTNYDTPLSQAFRNNISKL
jgi:hypothetical protein